MTNLELVKKVIGNINPIGDSGIDRDRYENLKEICFLIRDLISEVEYVAFNKESAYESSVVKARDFTFNFLSGELGIGYTHDQKGDEIISKERDLDKIREYLFNTGVWNKGLSDYNISEEYMKQTLEFLNTLE